MKVVIHIEHDGVNALTWKSNTSPEVVFYLFDQVKYAILSGLAKAPPHEGRPPDIQPGASGSVLAQRLAGRPVA